MLSPPPHFFKRLSDTQSREIPLPAGRAGLAVPVGRERCTLLAISRQGLFFLPLILLLPTLFDSILGVQLAQPTADLLTAILALPLVIRFWRKISLREAQEKNN